MDISAGNLGFLLAAHLTILTVSGTRLLHRLFSYGLWFDDLLKFMLAVGDSFLVVMLLSDVTEITFQSQHHLLFSIFFVVVWLSRASLAMATGRVYATCKLKHPVRQCLTLAAADLSAGIVFSILSATTCNEETNCTECGPCICILPMRLVVSALLADIIADIAMIRMNYMMLFGIDFGSECFRKSLLVFGFSSTALTLIIGIVCWTLYISHLSGYPMVIFSLVRVKSPSGFIKKTEPILQAITSLIASNMPVFIGTFCCWLYRKNVGNQNQTVLLEGIDSDEIHPKATMTVSTGATALDSEVISVGQISTNLLSTTLV